MVKNLSHDLSKSLVIDIGDFGGVSSKKVVIATPSIVISGNQATITCDTTGATIYYTLDGSTPTSSSTQYSSAITLNASCTVKAIAIKGSKSSAVAEATYTQPVVATPVIVITGLYTVTITCAMEDATIYYTLDGSTPTSNSTEYTSAISLTDSCIIKAIAVKSGMTDSEVASENYDASSAMSEIVDSSTETTNPEYASVIVDYTNYLLYGLRHDNSEYEPDLTGVTITIDNVVYPAQEIVDFVKHNIE